MANAEALFTRHAERYLTACNKIFRGQHGVDYDLKSKISTEETAVLYAACIVAEAIRSDFEEAKSDIKEPHIDI